MWLDKRSHQVMSITTIASIPMLTLDRLRTDHHKTQTLGRDLSWCDREIPQKHPSPMMFLFLQLATSAFHVNDCKFLPLYNQCLQIMNNNNKKNVVPCHNCLVSFPDHCCILWSQRALYPREAVSTNASHLFPFVIILT